MAAAAGFGKPTCFSGSQFPVSFQLLDSQFSEGLLALLQLLCARCGVYFRHAALKHRTDFVLLVMNVVLRAVDCIQGMDEMDSQSVDVVVTSPPYNLGIKYNKYNDSQKQTLYLNWTKHWVSAVSRVLKYDGSFFLNVGGCPTRPLMPYEILLAVKDTFILQNTFHWIKAISIDQKDGALSVGHFKPLNSKRYVNDCHEFVFHFTKTGNVVIDRLSLGVPYMDKSNVRRWSHTSGNDKRCRGNTWFIPYKTIQSRDKQRPHPATFPPQLAENAIRVHGVGAGMTVLDPFLGIGSSALGAMDAGVDHFVGFDIDEKYIADAHHFIEEKRNQK